MTTLATEAVSSKADNQATMAALASIGKEHADPWEVFRLSLKATQLVGKPCEVKYLGNAPKGQKPEIISKQGSFLGLVPLLKNRRFALQFRFEGTKVREPRIPTDRIVSVCIQEDS